MSFASLSALVLSDGEIVLRPASSKDEALIATWLHDPEIYKWWGGEPASDAYIAEHCSVQTDETGTSWPFIIMCGADAAGYIQAWESKNDRGIDLFIAPDRRREGLATRAAAMLATHLRDVCGWQSVTADPDAANKAAIAMWQKVGFQPNGRGLYIFR